jgi:hypothetical protein
MVYLTTLSVAQVVWIGMITCLLNNELEQMWKEAFLGQILGTIPALTWRDRGKPKSIIRIVCVSAEIRTMNLPRRK